ncbi:hypothetical protein ADICYQ_2951 [Cyclobacterium qasimii M12-11B]|uniref:Uncharacterized protein n=1 Tax=Cyclobacterium qasimii M12-11B TaxID=641524 RepID=S7WMA8_9BACT|nr:hypothetical protein ADICYQ_2951 [Cyclobacterium qasimii M12-11B]
MTQGLSLKYWRRSKALARSSALKTFENRTAAENIPFNNIINAIFFDSKASSL